MHCLRYLERKFTVFNVIQFCANVSGGVHLGKAVDEIDARLSDLDRTVSMEGLSASVSTIPGIAAVVMDGIAPVIAALQAES